MSFLEYWKRKQASLSHHWDVMDFEEEEVGRTQTWLFFSKTSLISMRSTQWLVKQKNWSLNEPIRETVRMLWILWKWIFFFTTCISMLQAASAKIRTCKYILFVCVSKSLFKEFQKCECIEREIMPLRIAVACATWCHGGICQSEKRRRRSGYICTLWQFRSKLCHYIWVCQSAFPVSFVSL